MSKTRPMWNEYFLLLAKFVSTRSTCNSRPVGAVVVKDNHILATGYNGAKSGIAHCIDLDDFENGNPFCFRRSLAVSNSEKYNFCKSTHAEINAIEQALKRGISIKDSTLYVTLAPCFPCLKRISEENIKNVYYELPYESGSLENDLIWEQQAMNAGLSICEQLTISSETYDFCLGDIRLPTSRRRMKATK